MIADGFFEWKQTMVGKVPMRVVLRFGEPFAFAGLWETWRPPEGEVVDSCTIITTAPNALMEPIHSRMPVMLSRATEARWLDMSQSDNFVLKGFLVPYSSG